MENDSDEREVKPAPLEDSDSKQISKSWEIYDENN